MRKKIEEQGVLIPKQWLEGVDEVDIVREENRIVVVPVKHDDPIRLPGRNPVTDEVDDASVEHDQLIYAYS